MNALQQYAKIKGQIKELEGKLDQLKPEIEELVADEPQVTKWGTFKMVYVPRWKFSEELSTKKKMTLDRLKLAEKEEIATGKAEKISDGGRLVFSNK